MRLSRILTRGRRLTFRPTFRRLTSSYVDITGNSINLNSSTYLPIIDETIMNILSSKFAIANDLLEVNTLDPNCTMAKLLLSVNILSQGIDGVNIITVKSLLTDLNAQAAKGNLSKPLMHFNYSLMH